MPMPIKESLKLRLKILAHCPVSADSMGGGDRIMIETFRRLQNNFRLSLSGSGEAIGMAKNCGFTPEFWQITDFPVKKYGVLGAYWHRFWWSVSHRLPIENDDVLYSASEFIIDTLPVASVKRKKRFFWIVGLYLIAPNPFLGQTRFTLNSVLFFLTQRWSFQLMRPNADLILVLCQDDREILINKFGFEPDKVLVIAAGVNLAEIAKVKPGAKDLAALFVGRFHRQKGLPDLIAAWTKISQTLPKAKLGIIGWGQPAEVAALKKAIGEHNLDRSITLLGFKDGKEKIALMKSAQVLIFPSHYESWGIVALEAMAAGLPVVGYDLPVYRDTFGPALVKTPAFDIDKLAENVVKVLTDGGFANKQGRLGSELAKKFTWDNTARAIKKRIP